MSEVEFTIVTPSFNQGRFLSATLDSVARQTVTSYEHLIFDPGSTDASQDIISAYTKQAPDRRRHVFGKDKSQTNAINLGFAEARGEYICWLNSDDAYFDAGVLAAVKERFESDPAIDIVYGLGEFIDVSGNTIRSAYINKNPGDLRSAFLTSIGILQPSLFMRRRVFETCGPLFEGMNYSFDYEYWVRALFAGMTFSFLPRNLSRAVIHDDAKTMSNRGVSLAECAEVCKKFYGFVSKEWVDRLESFRASGSDGIVQTSNDSVAPTKYVSEYVDLSAAATWLHLPSATLSRSAILPNSPLGAERKIVTGFDRHYFEQGLTLVSSLGRHGYSGPVVIYDLGLTAEQANILRAIHGVFLVKPPTDLSPGDWYLRPKNYVYKNLFAYHAALGSSENALILWVDAGVAFQRDTNEIFNLINRSGTVFVDHDDRPSWPFFNATFTVDAALTGMKATVAEAAAPHICSCLFGFRNDDVGRALVEESYKLSRDPAVSLGEKHPAKKIPLSNDLVVDRFHILQRGAEQVTVSLLPEIRKIFGYSGHRQDQSIFSILAARHSGIVASASRYCRATDTSSLKSKLNHESGSVDQTIESTAAIDPEYAGALSIHHRGTYRNFDHLRFEGQVMGDACAVIGNGPSLKGFDLRKLGRMASIGMNAAYRHWERIGWYPSYYACLDLVVGESHRDAILEMVRNRRELGIQLFLLRSNLAEWLRERIGDPAVVNFDILRLGSAVLSADPVTTGSHSAAFAAMLGYTRIYLLGIDCNYVEKVQGAVSLGGNILEISEEIENPNYFFDDYQRAGDRFNIPNPNPGLHLRAWERIAPSVRARGAEIFNTNETSAVTFFKESSVDHFVRCESLGDHPPLARDAHAGVDETGVVAHLLANRTGRQFVMLDVGAHFGTSAAYFDKLGWTIYCFEPDPKNRSKLLERFSAHENVIIDTRAVSDTPATSVSFFTSEVSTGISGMLAFHDTHKQTGLVDVTTISDFIRSRNVDSIDFLKIDVEGFDLSVLKGVPWESVLPDVIEAEFEDAKTEKLGHNFVDICEYLVDRGYTVYLSEWHPIIRYGIPHDWCRVVRYPAALLSKSAWGNLLAFRNDPGEATVRAAFDACVKFRKTAPVQLKNAADPGPANDDKRSRPDDPYPVASGQPSSMSDARSTDPAILSFKDRHKGERCFIVGNGPSLNLMDLSKLAGQTVFASNGVDLLFDRIDWRPTYYACVDSRVLPDRADAVKAMLQANPDMTGFFPNRLTDHGGKDAPRDTRGLIGVLPNAVFFSERPNDPTRGVEGMFAFDLNDGLVQPYTVTITLMQLAAWMGFAEIVLIGCDTDYVVPVSVRQDGPSVEGGKLLLTSTADDDPNHFDPRYFGKDRQWHQPQVGKMIQHYQYAAQALASKGVRVVNATVGGKLEVFDRVDYGGLFERTSQPEIDVLIVRPDAVGRAAISRIPASVPVMVLGDAPDLGQGLRADYLVGAMGAAAFSDQRLEVLCGDGSGLRRVLVDPGAGKTLMTSNRAMDVDFLLNVIWTDVDRATLSTTGLALLWAQALGYRAIGLGGATIGAALDASADIRDRVIQMGLSVAVIH